MGISAYHMIRKHQTDLYKRSFQIAAIIGTGAVVLVGLNKHSQAQHMVEAQPMKMAAAEALWNTESPASFSLLSITDLSQRKDVFSIRIPRLLCLLSYSRLDCTVRGVYDLQQAFEQQYGPGDYIPPVAVVYWSFRIMVWAGLAMLLLAFFALFMVKGGMFEEKPRIMRLFFWAIALPYVATTAGWVMTEIGRFPWVVYGLMRIEEGISPSVTGGQVLLTVVGFTLVYGALMVADIYLLVKFARAGPSGESALEVEEEPPPSLAPA